MIQNKKGQTRPIKIKFTKIILCPNFFVYYSPMVISEKLNKSKKQGICGGKTWLRHHGPSCDFETLLGNEVEGATRQAWMCDRIYIYLLALAKGQPQEAFTSQLKTKVEKFSFLMPNDNVTHQWASM